MDDIRKCGISCLKLHGELPTEQLHDVGAEKFQILTCSPESLYEESVREQLLKLQKISYAWLSTRLTVCYTGKYETVGRGCESLSND